MHAIIQGWPLLSHDKHTLQLCVVSVASMGDAKPPAVEWVFKGLHFTETSNVTACQLPHLMFAGRNISLHHSVVATGVQKALSDYQELAKSSEVDIVYVSNLHPAHKDTTILMLQHGKHVLCEKPLAVSP